MSSLTTNLRRTALFGRRLTATLLARTAGETPEGRREPVESAEFHRELDEAIARLPGGTLAEHAIVHVPGNRAPWLQTDMQLDVGDQVTWIANGRVHVSRLFDIYVEPHFQLWAKIEGGEAFRGLRDTHTFTATTAGRLELASYFPGEWSTRDGGFETPAQDWAGMTGGMDVALLRWSGDAESGLRALESAGCERAGAEAARLRLGNPMPNGWRYLWFLGPGEIYRRGNDDGRRCIECHTHCDAGILRREVDIELKDDTTLRWQWNVSELPSRFGEDLLPTHDYVSIAVEYDNGIDVTYYWSAELPVGEGYWCPLPTWTEREYHIVVRSGTQGLGTWKPEERNLSDDYRKYVGEPPSRIKRIWLIANSIFQRGHGRCRYAGISIGGPNIRQIVL